MAHLSQDTHRVEVIGRQNREKVARERETDGTYEALVAYIRENQRAFYRLALSYVKNPDNAMDVVQEAVLRALSKADTLREPQYMKTWFYRILINESITFLRRNRRFADMEDCPEPAEATGEDHDLRMDLRRAVDALPEKYRTIIMLRFFEDMQLVDIARVTGSNLNTVKTRLYAALKRLQPLVGSEETNGSGR